MQKFMAGLVFSCLILGGPFAVAAQAEDSLPAVTIPGGSFPMGGDPVSGQAVSSARMVSVADFRMARSEASYGLFCQFVSETGYVTTCEKDGKGAFIYNGDDIFLRKAHRNWRTTNFPQTPDFPVASISWFDAIQFANWLSLRDGLKPVYDRVDGQVVWHRQNNGWRLPTEAEWEYAAFRSTKGTVYPGSDDVDAVAWYYWNAGHAAHPVMGKLPGALGIYDLCGNVSEWCWDWFGPYDSTIPDNPVGPDNGVFRIYRGGSWIMGHWGQETLKITDREFAEPDKSYNYTGVRLVRN